MVVASSDLFTDVEAAVAGKCNRPEIPDELSNHMVDCRNLEQWQMVVHWFIYSMAKKKYE